MRPRTRFCAGFLVLALAACAPTPSPSRAPVSGVATSHWKVELFFGRGSSPGGEVSDEEWRRFVDEVITPAFPDGLSVVDATGQWRRGDGTLEHERSEIVVVIVAEGQLDVAKIDAVRAAYRARFHQESVLRVIERVDAAF